MKDIDRHPTVVSYREGRAGEEAKVPPLLEADVLHGLCIECGADDAGFAALDVMEPEEEQRRILEAFPRARTLISMVVRLNRDALRSTSRSTSDLEYLCAMKRLDEAARRIIPRLAEQGVRAIAPATGFPMDQDHWPDRSWAVAHKLVAEAAGMGRRGLNRLLLHPRFGGHVVLGTIILDAEVAPLGEPLDFDPCLQCKLCVAVCPVGSVGSDGHFSFSNCIVHNYRDRM